MVRAPFLGRRVRVDTTLRAVSMLPHTGLDVALFLALSGTTFGLLVSGYGSGLRTVAIVAYGLLALFWGLCLFPENQRALTIDLHARRVVVDPAYGQGHGTETRLEDLTFELKEGFTRRKRGRMAPWAVLRAVVDAGTPEERTLFTSDASDAPRAIAALRELACVLAASSRDPVLARELDLAPLEARVASVGQSDRIAGPSAVAFLLLPGMLACLVALLR